MKSLKYIFLFLSLIILPASGCAAEPEPDSLSPDQVTSEMSNQLITVKARIDWAVDNPGGLGGTYLSLDDGRVSVRIQHDTWSDMNFTERARFKKGKTIIAEGTLFIAGEQMVIVYGKTPPYPPDRD